MFFLFFVFLLLADYETQKEDDEADENKPAHSAPYDEVEGRSRWKKIANVILIKAKNHMSSQLRILRQTLTNLITAELDTWINKHYMDNLFLVCRGKQTM